MIANPITVLLIVLRLSDGSGSGENDPPILTAKSTGHMNDGS